MYAILKTKPEKGIEVISVAERPMGDNDVRVKMHYCGICGTDLAIYNWRAHKRNMKNELPRIIGHEGVGTIVEKGKNVMNLDIGQRIVTEPIIHCGYCEYCRAGLTNICPNFKSLGTHWDGCMAEYATIPSKICFPTPANLKNEEVPLLEILGVPVHALERVGSVLGKDCAVVGPGAVGLTTVLVLKAMGAASITVFGTPRGEKRLQKAKELGADEIVIVEEEIPKQYQGQFHFVFEAAGKALALFHCSQLVSIGGKIGMMGAYDEQVPIQFNNMIRSREVDMISSRARTHTAWMRSIALVEQGKISLSGFEEDILPLQNAVEGFKRVSEGRSFKVLLDCEVS